MRTRQAQRLQRHAFAGVKSSCSGRVAKAKNFVSYDGPRSCSTPWPHRCSSLEPWSSRLTGGEWQLGSYRFSTRWDIQAPLHQVWDVIVAPTAWPTWWKGVQSAKVLDPGAEDGVGQRIRYAFKSALPYTLSFDIVLREVNWPHLLLGDTYGDLEGFGRWSLAENDGVTILDNTWQVRTTGTAMNMLAPLLRPAFVWNHHVVMRWGAEGLARYLEAPLLGITSAPKPRLADAAPLTGLGAVLALTVYRWRRHEHSNTRR
jgi:uncharacterized protein YndB with AHSA1/START domain